MTGVEEPEEMVVTPWRVSGDVDYNRLVEQFGTSPMTQSLLDRLERHAGKGLVLVVPGKVLSVGEFSKRADVAAYSFSQRAAEKIAGAGGKVMTLEELLESNPKGQKAKMVI